MQYKFTFHQRKITKIVYFTKGNNPCNPCTSTHYSSKGKSKKISPSRARTAKQCKMVNKGGFWPQNQIIIIFVEINTQKNSFRLTNCGPISSDLFEFLFPEKNYVMILGQKTVFIDSSPFILILLDYYFCL